MPETATEQAIAAELSTDPPANTAAATPPTPAADPAKPPEQQQGTEPPTKAQLLERAALQDAARRRKTREEDVARAKRVDQYGDALAKIEGGDVRAGLRALLGPKYTANMVVELMQDFPDPAEATPQQIAEAAIRKYDDQKKTEEKKATDDRLIAGRERADTQINGFISEAGKLINDNLDTYEGIETYYLAKGEKGADDLADEIDRRLVDHFEKTGEGADPSTVVEAIEEEARSWLGRTRRAPKPTAADELSELDTLPVLRTPPPPANGRKLSLEEEIERDLAEADARERQQLRVRR